MWHQICWVQFRSASPTVIQRRNVQNMAKTVATQFIRIVTDNASGILAKTTVPTTYNHAAPLANLPASPRGSLQSLPASPLGSLHLHQGQAFVLALLISRATRLDNLSAAATMAVATVQAMTQCATTIPRITQDGTIVQMSRNTIAITRMTVIHLAAP